ncbi:Cmx/CmrA family chloramphenicol efflux MFS transporter [Nocardia thailandica]
MPIVVFVLAAAVFAQGTSEFMVSGLLEQIAVDVGVSLGSSGWLTSLFAAGMVVGAPVMVMAAGRLPVRNSVTVLLGLFCLAHVAAAATTGFSMLLVTRVVAALANAGFLAIVLATLPRLVVPAMLGRASTVVVSGVTVACVAGVPAGTLLGQYWGWRAAFWAVAAVSAALLVPVWVMLGDEVRDGLLPTRQEPTMLREWLVLRQGPVVGAVVAGILVNAATFAAFIYFGAITANTAGSGRWVPVVLALFGVGSFLGVTVTGRYSDRYQRRIILAGTGVLAGIWVLVAVTAHALIGLLVMSVVSGAVAFGVGSTLIATIVQTATALAPRICGALATTAVNIGAVLGPVTAGLVVDRIDRATAALWCSAAFTTTAVGVVGVVMRRRGTRPVEQVRAGAR